MDDSHDRKDNVGSSSTQNLVDNSNYDGYANNSSLIAVGAITNQGVRASYSERGANLWISSYSGESGGSSITTTDLTGDNWGYNPGGISPNTGLTANNYINTSYTNSFNGTSAAAPSVSGTIALLLKEKPELTYRDIKLILAKSARKNDPGNTEWTNNSVGIPFNPHYGFGVIDAESALTLTKSWSSVGGFSAQKIHNSLLYGGVSLGAGLTTTITIPISGSGISRIEFVELVLDKTHSDPGNLEFELESPSFSTGNRAKLYERHLCYSQRNRTGGTRICNPIQGFSFGASQFLDETADGNWKVSFRNFHTSSGQLNSARLRFYGR